MFEQKDLDRYLKLQRFVDDAAASDQEIANAKRAQEKIRAKYTASDAEWEGALNRYARGRTASKDSPYMDTRSVGLALIAEILKAGWALGKKAAEEASKRQAEQQEESLEGVELPIEASVTCQRGKMVLRAEIKNVDVSVLREIGTNPEILEQFWATIATELRAELEEHLGCKSE